eukprot:15337944-Ditylum_brightwellii.AAC.1
METKQVEVGKSPTKLSAANIPTYKKPKNSYVVNRPNRTVKKVCNPYVVTSTPTKINKNTKTSVPSCNQYSPAEYFPTSKTPTNSLGTGTKPAYVPVIHDSPCIQTAIVLYASACESRASQQKMSLLPNTTRTSEYVPTHMWSTNPPAPDTNFVRNLTAGTDFNKPFFLDSTGDISNNDAFLYHNNFLT